MWQAFAGTSSLGLTLISRGSLASSAARIRSSGIALLPSFLICCELEPARPGLSTSFRLAESL